MKTAPGVATVAVLFLFFAGWLTLWSSRSRRRRRSVRALYLTTPDRAGQQKRIERLLDSERHLQWEPYSAVDDPADGHAERVHKAHLQMLDIAGGWDRGTDALILEDDAYWDAGTLLPAITRLREEWGGWDVLVLGSGKGDICPHAIEWSSASARFSKSATGCHAYVVRAEIAREVARLLDRPGSRRVCIERVSWPSKLKVVTAVPSVAYQLQDGKADGRFHWVCRNGRREPV